MAEVIWMKFGTGVDYGLDKHIALLIPQDRGRRRWQLLVVNIFGITALTFSALAARFFFSQMRPAVYLEMVLSLVRLTANQALERSSIRLYHFAVFYFRLNGSLKQNINFINYESFTRLA